MELWVIPWMGGPQEWQPPTREIYRGRPGGGATYPDIPAAVVLGVVMPPEEAVTPYPGVCSTTWLHDWGESVGRLPGRCTRSPCGSSNGKSLVLSTSLEAGVGPQLEGSYCGPDWVAAPAGLPQHLVPRQPNSTNSALRDPLGSLPVEAPSQAEEV